MQHIATMSSTISYYELHYELLSARCMPCARCHVRSPPPPCHSPRAIAPPAAHRRCAAPLCPTPPLAARCSASPRLASRGTARHLIARCAARCATHCAAHCAAPLTAPHAACRSSRRSSRCSLASVRDQRAHMISIQVTLSNAREEAQLWGIAIGRMAGAHLTLVN